MFVLLSRVSLSHGWMEGVTRGKHWYCAKQSSQNPQMSSQLSVSETQISSKSNAKRAKSLCVKPPLIWFSVLNLVRYFLCVCVGSDWMHSSIINLLCAFILMLTSVFTTACSYSTPLLPAPSLHVCVCGPRASGLHLLSCRASSSPERERDGNDELRYKFKGTEGELACTDAWEYRS